MRFRLRKKSSLVLTPEQSRKRRIKFALLTLLVLILGSAGWVVISGVVSLNNISAKNNETTAKYFELGSNVTPEQASKEGESRINVALIGIGGANHAGGQLADTIQVASFDPVNKTMNMVSVPRDLAIKSASGARAKINTVYANGSSYCQTLVCPKGSDAGGIAMKSELETILGVEIQYFIRLDFDGFKKIVDTLGGVEIYLEKALNDPEYPDKLLLGFDPLYIPAGNQKMNGETALKYARSRKSTSDFDRAARQQKLIEAVRSKALSVKVLANPKKISDLITTLGSHIKTDLTASEMLKMTELASSINKDATVTVVLDTTTEGPLKSQSDSNLGYIIVPKLGLDKYADLQLYTASVFADPFVIKEKATVVIKDGTGKAKGELLKTALSSAGYNVSTVTVVASQNKTSISTNKNKPFSTKYLQARLPKTTTTTAADSDPATIVITLGTDYLK